MRTPEYIKHINIKHIDGVHYGKDWGWIWEEVRTPKHIIQAYDDNSDHYHAGKYWSLIREEVYTV